MTYLTSAPLALLFLFGAAIPAQAGPFDIPEEERETYLDLGVAYLDRAAYVGSDETDSSIYPYVAAEYEGRWFFNPAQGAGVNLINRNGLVVAPTVYYASGRDAEDTPFGVLAGAQEAFDLDGSVTVGGIVSYLLPFARADVQMQVPVSGDVDGFRGDVSLTTRLPLGERLYLLPGVRATYQSDDWAQSYYGFDGPQIAVASQTVPAPFGEVDGGFNTLGAHLIGYLEVADNINLIGAVNYSTLQGDAKDSLLSPDNDAFTFVAGIARRF